MELGLLFPLQLLVSCGGGTGGQMNALVAAMVGLGPHDITGLARV